MKTGPARKVARDRARNRMRGPEEFYSSEQKSLRESFDLRRLLMDPGDNRLSRLGHYHGPGGLNGRVRDGNGCGPAGMVAGKPIEEF